MKKLFLTVNTVFFSVIFVLPVVAFGPLDAYLKNLAAISENGELTIFRPEELKQWAKDICVREQDGVSYEQNLKFVIADVTDNLANKGTDRFNLDEVSDEITYTAINTYCHELPYSEVLALKVDATDIVLTKELNDDKPSEPNQTEPVDTETAEPDDNTTEPVDTETAEPDDNTTEPVDTETAEPTDAELENDKRKRDEKRSGLESLMKFIIPFFLYVS